MRLDVSDKVFAGFITIVVILLLFVVAVVVIVAFRENALLTTLGVVLFIIGYNKIYPAVIKSLME